MSKKVLLLHGWGGSDYPHWQSWLAGEIAKDYGCVNFLKFSNFDAPKLDVWMQELEAALVDFKPDIVICHSLANTLWFHLCNTKTVQEIKKLYLVAPPSLTCNIEELSEFFPVSAPNQLYAKETLLIASTNDPYMSLDEVHQLQQRLHVKMKILKNAGHINADSGYGKWEWMHKELQTVL
ncbi:serine hydrolase family protein [Sulfurimonas sediminis]|uniref:Serine hydrolase family protein n=1 Tax=Sulfurimonas sediminis TaxID=2590020 RepID=A0A7M1B4I6_9BACT|nr:alpha/beta hydrolase [Sulfurimonas sediminis]QOP44580.1 serine hydrolase family protein [Sulfurimonas sediminis]